MRQQTGYLGRAFGYRRLYVDAILERAPHRAVLAVASEIARLCFAASGCALVALIFWLLTGAAFARHGLGLLSFVFGLLAAVSTLFCGLSLIGIWRAAGDVRRVRAAALRRNA